MLFSAAMCENNSVGNKRPTIVHVVTSLYFGGVEKHMELISEQLNEASMRHIFVAIGGGAQTAENLTRNGAEVICLDGRVRIPSLLSIIRLARLFRKLRAFGVHTHGAEANFHGLLAATLAGVPIRIGEEIGMPNHKYKAKAIFRQVYRAADRIIGVSKAVSQWLVGSGEVPQNKIVCMYYPVRLPAKRLSLTRELQDRLRVCFVGRLEPGKNPLVLIPVVRELRDIGVPIEFWIIGDGSQRRDIECEIRKNNLSKEVQLLGFQSDPSQFIRQSSVVVQPSLQEGFGIALVEAMGCGVPVVATSVGGPREFIEPGITGWLLDDASAKTLTGVLHSAWILGAERLFEMGQRARLAVEGRFEPSRYVARLEELYFTVAEERGMVIKGMSSYD